MQMTVYYQEGLIEETTSAKNEDNIEKYEDTLGTGT